MVAAGAVVVRGGMALDNSGSELSQVDVAIVGGRIFGVGPVAIRSDVGIDTGHRLVAPRFVDMHGQVIWGSRTPDIRVVAQ